MPLIIFFSKGLKVFHGFLGNSVFLSSSKVAGRGFLFVAGTKEILIKRKR